jgi:hypothetical protein
MDSRQSSFNNYDNIINQFDNLKYKLNVNINNYKQLKRKYDNLVQVYEHNVNLSNKQNVNRFDSTISPITFNINNSILIKRSSGGSFPRFAFKPDNKIFNGNDYNTIKVTFRWAGNPQSYDYYQLNNKKWCVGIGNGASLCRTTDDLMPPKTGEYVTYTLTSTHSRWINHNLQWLNWVGPSINYNSKYDAVWEFKEIKILINEKYKLKLFNDLKSSYKLINNNINDMNNLIKQLLKYDIIGKNEIKIVWDKMLEKSNELNEDYNNLLITNNNDLNAQKVEQNLFLTTNSIRYTGWIILNIVLITVLIKNITRNN